MESDEAVIALAALAQTNRLALFRLLVRAGPEGRTVTQISAALGVRGATLSFHLTQLRQAKLISCQRDGRALIYTAEFAAMNELLAYLTENCCQGDEAACAPAPCCPTGAVP